jgi:bacterioferritin
VDQTIGNPKAANGSAGLSDTADIKKRARKSVEDGAVTSSYGNVRAKEVCRILNEALATEITCVLRYRRHYFSASGIDSAEIKKEFLVHSNEELAHADKIAERIVQLGGEPDLNPATLLARSHADYVPGKDLKGMIREDLIAERIAIESYREMIGYVSGFDPTTRKLLVEVLEQEEAHADELKDWLED